MEPKALLSIMNSPVKNDVTRALSGGLSFHLLLRTGLAYSVRLIVKPSVAASIERARRKSLQFAPKSKQFIQSIRGTLC